MENSHSEMPCKIRKRRLPTASSSSFANNSLSQLFMEDNINDSPRNEKCINSTVDQNNTGLVEEESLQKSSAAHEVFDKSITNVDRSRNKSRTSPGLVSAPEVINPRYRHPSSFMEKDKSFGGLQLIYDANPFEGKSQPCGNTETDTKDRKRSMHKSSTHSLDEIKHSLTISKELLKLLTHVCVTDKNHDDHHPTSISLASTLNHELNKARSNVNKLIQEQRSNNSTIVSHESKEQDKIRFAVKTIARELETERKLRKQTERMNKKLGRELASTKASLAKAIKEAESEKQATEVLEQLCEKMAHSIEEDRVELEVLKKESERVREEMEEEREMLRVADMLREERLHMKLIDAKHEYEDKHEQMNVLVRDLEELLEGDNNGVEHLKKTPKVLSWFKCTRNTKRENKNNTKEDILWYDNKSEVVNDQNALAKETRGVSWYENNIGEVGNDEMVNTGNDVIGRNSDCIELEFGLDLKNESGFSEERVLGLSSSSTMKEYEDEMERYKMIKDLRDRIVSGSDLSRDTIESGSYI